MLTYRHALKTINEKIAPYHKFKKLNNEYKLYEICAISGNKQYCDKCEGKGCNFAYIEAGTYYKKSHIVEFANEKLGFI